MAEHGKKSQVAFPNAKVNLGLQVRGQRADGFHDLDSLFLPVPWCDTLELVSPGSGKGCLLNLHGNPIKGNPSDNLICRAYSLLSERHAIPPVDFHLIKVLPSGAGLGGGSANGAFALTLLNAHFELGLSPVELEGIAAELGSDCPFFIRNVPARVTGRGEHSTPIHLNLSGWHIALINPGVHIHTSQAFDWIVPNDNRPGLSEWAGTSPPDWAGKLTNDFTGPVCERHPMVREALNSLLNAGAAYAEMSGSGSTVFGFFEDMPPKQWTAQMPEGWRHWSGQFPL